MIILDSESKLFEYPHHNSMISYYKDNGFGTFEESIDEETNTCVVGFVYEGYDDFYTVHFLPKALRWYRNVLSEYGLDVFVGGQID